jgi:hypothetical protein
MPYKDVGNVNDLGPNERGSEILVSLKRSLGLDSSLQKFQYKMGKRNLKNAI